jgi:CheY-like chemotaxis protein
MTRTILLADDSVTIRKVVELTFSDTDIRVEAVESGQEAMERLDRLEPDIVLADVVMPGPTGYEICERVKGSSRPVPVLLLAGTFEPFDPDRARACGADGHLVKPFESRTLVQRVEALLARGSLAAPTPPVAAEEELESVLDDLAARDEFAAASSAPEPSGAHRDLADLPAGEPEAPVAGQPEAWDDGTAAGTPETVRGPDEGPRAPAGRLSLSPEDADALAQAILTRAGGIDALAQAVLRQAGGVDEIARAVLLRLGGIDALARPIIQRLGSEALREIAWEVVPDLAELLIRERLRQIETEEHGRG